MEWFLINQNEHLGPFDEEILHELFHEGEITKDSLIWREGWSDAKTYEFVFMLEEEQKSFQPLSQKIESVYDKEPAENVIKEDELPPDLPPEVMDFKQKIASIKNVVEENKQPENAPVEVVKNTPSKAKEITKSDNLETPKVTAQVAKEPEGLADENAGNDQQAPTHGMEEFEEEVDVEDVFEYDYDVASEEKRLQKIIRQLVIALLTFVIVAPLILYIVNDEEIFSRPRTMSLEDYERLIQTAKDKSADIKFSFSLATDKRTLWLSTNIPLEGEVFINLKSQHNRTLGGLVEVKAKGILSKRLITLTEFQFIQGTKFVDGYYDAELYTVDDLTGTFYNRFFENREKQFRYLDDVLITSMHPAEFEKMLERKNQRKGENLTRFYEDLLQEYKTIREITEGIRGSVDEVFTKTLDQWQESVEVFDKAYKNNYGIFFTSFILNMEKQYKALSKQDFPDKLKIIAHYSKLKELATEIGKESVSVLENLKSADVMAMSTEQFQDLRYNSVLKFKLIIAECDEMIEKFD